MPLRESFTHEFPGLVWKLAFDHDGSRPALAVELRTPNVREATWAVVDLAENQVAWQGNADVGLASDEWLGLVGIFNGTLLLHRHATDTPQPRGLLALDGRTGQPRWDWPGLSFLSCDGRAVLALLGGREEARAVRLALVAGEVLENETVETVFSEKSPPEIPELLHYPETGPFFAPVAAFVRKRTGHEPVEAADYLDAGACLVVAYYFYANDALENWLLIVDKARNEWVSERIAAGPGLNPEPFAVYADRRTHRVSNRVTHWVIFVQDKNRLKVYEW